MRVGGVYFLVKSWIPNVPVTFSSIDLYACLRVEKVYVCNWDSAPCVFCMSGGGFSI